MWVHASVSLIQMEPKIIRKVIAITLFTILLTLGSYFGIALSTAIDLWNRVQQPPLVKNLTLTPE